MNREQYQASALLTCSKRFNLRTPDGDFEIGTGAPTVMNLYDVMKGVIEAARWLEAMKRALYYGNEFVPPDPLPELSTHLASEEEFRLAEISKQNQRVPTIQMLHAAIGITTEAGELLETIFFSMFGGIPLDVPNLIEELGDGEWYASVMRDQLGISQEDVQRGNIAKLRSRYPERKWEETAAIHRDTNAEIQAMNLGTRSKNI